VKEYWVVRALIGFLPGLERDDGIVPDLSARPTKMLHEQADPDL
jgi:hypothetical protein